MSDFTASAVDASSALVQGPNASGSASGVSTWYILFLIAIAILGASIGDQMPQVLFWLIAGALLIAAFSLRKQIRVRREYLAIALIGVLGAYLGSLDHDARFAAKAPFNSQQQNTQHPVENRKTVTAPNSKKGVTSGSHHSSGAPTVAKRYVTAGRDDLLYPTLRTACEYFSKLGADTTNNLDGSIERGLRILKIDAGEKLRVIGTDELACPGSSLPGSDYFHVIDGAGHLGWFSIQGAAEDTSRD